MDHTTLPQPRQQAGAHFNFTARRADRAPSAWERRAVLRIAVVPAPNMPASLRATMVSAEVAYLVSTLRTKVETTALRYLERTSWGLLAVYADPAKALSAARKLRQRKPGTGIRVRYGLYWGDVCVEPDGAPCGGEAEMLQAILFLMDEDRVSAPDGVAFPDRDRVLVPSGTVAQLPDELRTQFVSLGSFRVPGCAGTLEIWTESLSAFLGRKPTNTERTFGVAGLHPESLLDIWWERRLNNRERYAQE